VTDGKEGKRTFTDLGGKGRYFRVLCLKPSDYGIYSIWEIEFADKEA
jgi:hypothetical protein